MTWQAVTLSIVAAGELVGIVWLLDTLRWERQRTSRITDQLIAKARREVDASVDEYWGHYRTARERWPW